MVSVYNIIVFYFKKQKCNNNLMYFILKSIVAVTDFALKVSISDLNSDIPHQTGTLSSWLKLAGGSFCVKNRQILVNTG
jgi:hypothetical protein